MKAVTPEQLRIGRDALHDTIYRGGNKFLFRDQDLMDVAQYMDELANSIEELYEAIESQNKEAANSNLDEDGIPVFWED